MYCLLLCRLLLDSAVSYDEHLNVCVCVCVHGFFGFCMHHHRVIIVNHNQWPQFDIYVCTTMHTSTPNGYTHTHSQIPFVEIGTKSIFMVCNATWTKMRTCENKMESCYICLVLFCFNHLCLTGCFVLFVALQQLLLLIVYAFLMAFSLSRSH